MVKEWCAEPVNLANFWTGTKHDPWRRALARQHSKQDTLNGRAKALRHEIQFPEQFLIGSFSEQILLLIGWRWTH